MNGPCPEDGCPFVLEETDRDKAMALWNYHMRTRHGSREVAQPSSRPHRGGKGSGGGGVIDGVVDAIGDVFEGIIRAITD